MQSCTGKGRQLINKWVRLVYVFALYFYFKEETKRFLLHVQSNLDYPDLDYQDFFPGPNLVMNIY